MLYYVFTVDGDWREYFDAELPEEERAPRKEYMREAVEQEIKLAGRCLDGHLVHFIHASPRARTFFLEEPFLGLWKRIVENGGDVGVHCHEDDPCKSYSYVDIPRMEEVISEQVTILRENGLDVRAYRGGFLAFCAELVGVLERNGLSFDFSCEPGRHLVHGGKLVSDWRGSPASLYRMSCEDHRREGSSAVVEIPVGVSRGHSLYFERSAPEELKRVASDLKGVSEKESRDIVVSVLTHSYEYFSPGDIRVIEEKIALLKRYGRFVGIKEVSDML